jgi:hypothetical protein
MLRGEDVTARTGARTARAACKHGGQPALAHPGGGDGHALAQRRPGAATAPGPDEAAVLKLAREAGVYSSFAGQARPVLDLLA